MMDNSYPEESARPRDELDEALRPGVDAVRAQPVPLASLHRAMKNARQVDGIRRKHWRGVARRASALAGLIAATILLVLFLESGAARRSADEPVASVEVARDHVPAWTTERMEEKYDTQNYFKDLEQSDKKKSERDLVSGAFGQPTTTDTGTELLGNSRTATQYRDNDVRWTASGQPRIDRNKTPIAIDKLNRQSSGSSSNITPYTGVMSLANGQVGVPAPSGMMGMAGGYGGLGGMMGMAGGQMGMMGGTGGGMRPNGASPPQFPAPSGAPTPITTSATPYSATTVATPLALEKARKEVEDAKVRYQALTVLSATRSLDADAVATGKKQLDESLQKYRDVQSSLGKSAAAPAVWQQDRQRPTVARVYVGGGNSLDLVGLHVSVTIEGPRARTVVDHVFRNPHSRQLEGTFEYPLPTGASASYFAMFPGKSRDTAPARFVRRGKVPAPPVERLARLTASEVVDLASRDDWGTPMEARVVGKQKALETYEEIVRGRIDPGLLEYAAGNTFRGRVFPIPPKGFSRVVFAYEELLPFTATGMPYRFPLPHSKIDELSFTLNASTAECRQMQFEPEGAQREQGGGRVCFTKSWKRQAPKGDVVFCFTPPNAELQSLSGRQGESGPLYAYARIRPELPIVAAKPFAENAVFLLDTSRSEHPDRFAVSMRLLAKILETDPAIKRFNIITFDVAGRWLSPKGWLENTSAGRAEAMKRLDGIILEGATNLSAALGKLAQPDFKIAAGTPLNVFLLSDGQLNWGETDVPTLVAKFEERCRFPVRFHCYRFGLGADNLELFEALTRRGGGIFGCYGAADLPAAAAAHRRHCFQLDRFSLVDGPTTTDLLVAGRRTAVYPGGELIVAFRANEPGKVQLVLEGTYQGKRCAKRYPVEVRPDGELAPRGWAEVAVASLLSLNDPKLDDLVTAYCQQFGIGSRVASFLVLENQADFKRLNLEAERGKTVPGGDLGIFLDQAWRALAAPLGGRAAFEQFLAKLEPRMPLRKGPAGEHFRTLLALLGDADFALPENDRAGSLMHATQVPPVYRTSLVTNYRDAARYIAEAKRRALDHDEAGAVRALSSIVEEYPGRSDALRLVGYRLLDLKQASQAARLFQQIRQDRPFEPHSYRDLARSLEETGCFGAAAVHYEIVLAGAWHARFHQALKDVTREEYIRMMQQALRQRAVGTRLAEYFGTRLEELVQAKDQSDLRVSITWNTDATDVDLWIIEPDGTKCFYSAPRTKSGGELSQDQTQGYGPERYRIAAAKPGTYTIIVHYFRMNPNLIAGESHVNVMVTRHAGTPREESRRYNVILKKHDEQVEVCKEKF